MFQFTMTNYIMLHYLSAYSKYVRTSSSSLCNLNDLYSFNVSKRKNFRLLNFGFFDLRLRTENSDSCLPPTQNSNLSVRKVDAVIYLIPNLIVYSNFMRLRLNILSILSYAIVKTLSSRLFSLNMTSPSSS